MAMKTATTKKAPTKKATKKNAPAKKPTTQEAAARNQAGQPKLLSGGNPQIAKGDGDAPLQAYLDAMPGWKGEIGRRLDTLIVAAVPRVRKAIRWNSPFYGADKGWIVNFHCFTKYVRVAFFDGTSLTPLPPGGSKVAGMRYLDIRETDSLDEKQFVSWVKQAAKLPGWAGF